MEDVLDPLWEKEADVWNGTVDIMSAIAIWTWDEYQEMQGFNISDRLLEVYAMDNEEEGDNEED